MRLHGKYHGGISRTMHCRLCINCYGTGFMQRRQCIVLQIPHYGKYPVPLDAAPLDSFFCRIASTYIHRYLLRVYWKSGAGSPVLKSI